MGGRQIREWAFPPAWVRAAPGDRARPRAVRDFRPDRTATGPRLRGAGGGSPSRREAAARKAVDGQDAFTVTSANETGALTSKPIAPWEKVLSVTVRIDAPSRVTVNVEPTALIERVCHALV